MYKKIFILILSVFLLSNCGDKKEDTFAVVEDKSLSKQELKKEIPDSKELSSLDKNYIKSLISDWTQSEILFKEAKENHFHKDEKLKYKADKYFKTLVIQEYLNYYLNSNSSVPEDSIRKYYRVNKDSFKRESETVLVKHFFNNDYEKAKNVKQILVSGDNEKISELLSTKEYDSQYIESGNCIPKFEEIIFSGQNKEVYGPVVTDFGYHVIKVDKRFSKSSAKKFSEVRDEIEQKIAQSSNHTNYINFLDSLKSKYYWKINNEKINKILGES